MPKEKKSRVYYYSDVYNDDFAETNLERPKIPETYVYIRTGKFKRFLSSVFYFSVIPLLWIVSKIWLGTKVKGRKNVKKLKHTGYCVYSNHTHYLDAFVPQVCVTRWKRTNILGYADALTIPVAKHMVKALGLIPVEKNNPKALLKMTEAINHYLDQKEAILIYPEGHIWPFYNGVRPLKPGPFRYPALKHLPMLAICSTWRKVWYSRKPKQTIHISEPFYYNDKLSEHENCDLYAEKTYRFFAEITSKYGTYEYIKYVKKEEKND